MRRSSPALLMALALTVLALITPAATAAPARQDTPAELAPTPAAAAQAAAAAAAEGTTTVRVTFTGNVPRQNSTNNGLLLVRVAGGDPAAPRTYVTGIPFTTEATSTATFSAVEPGTYVLWTGRYRAWGKSNIPAGTVGPDGSWTYDEDPARVIVVGEEPVTIGPVELPTGARMVGRVVDSSGYNFNAYVEAASTSGTHIRWNEQHPEAAVDGRFAMAGLGPGPYTVRVENGGGYWILPGPNGPVVSAVPGPLLLDPELGDVVDIGRVVMPHVFEDVHVTTEHSAAMWWMRTTGYSTGYPDGTYRSYEPVRRDAMAAFLYRAAGSPPFTPSPTSPFVDIRPGDPFYKEMSWLASRNISRGWPDGTFRPLEPVNRDAMAAFLYRFVETTRIYEGSQEDPRLFVDSEVGGFFDVPVGTQFRREIAWAASAGIATGWGGSQFAPLSPVNRDAMAAFLFRTITDPQTWNSAYEPTGATAVQ